MNLNDSLQDAIKLLRSEGRHDLADAVVVAAVVVVLSATDKKQNDARERATAHLYVESLARRAAGSDAAPAQAACSVVKQDLTTQPAQPEAVRLRDELLAVLAARQPQVQEAVGEIVASDEGELQIVFHAGKPLAPMKLYAAPLARFDDQQSAELTRHYGAHAYRMSLALRRARMCLSEWVNPATKERVLQNVGEVLEAYAKREPLPGQAVDVPYSIDTDPAGIRARVADAITGTLMVAAQGHTPPPAGHWAEPFWQAARADAARTLNVALRLREMVVAAKYMRDRVVETNGVKCMDDLDAAIDAAEEALTDAEALLS